ncbi:MAG TPA: hypothetical protein VM143_04610 [Acidimicrobiales bacterium]|nr:hypothetical protein [Acidimicrobiales bacterium]
MNRSTLARRYAPLAALAAVQLLIIATVPSTAPTTVAAEGGAFTPSGDVAGDGGAALTEETVPGEVPADGAVTDPATAAAGGGGGATTGGGAAAARPGATAGGGAVAGGGAASGGGGAAPGATAASGDTSHCVDGRQFDPGIYYWAPKCVAKFTGKNPGATYQGVTDKEVKVILYRGKPNAAVDAILDAIGANPSDSDVSEFTQKAVSYINSKFEFYGRKLVVEEFKGKCETVPPDYVCLRGEMRDIVRDKQPFLVQWGTPLASPAFDELSAQKVVNVGGQHFRDSFSQQRRPYHWDVAISGTVAAKQAAEWYCRKLAGKKAVFAGATGPDSTSQNPPVDDIQSKPRVLGVISTDDPENQGTITSVFKPELAKCGVRVEHEFYYAQDISRAQEQRTAGVAKMREAPESTTIAFFGDAVAPVFLYRTCQEQSYFPEQVIVGFGGMDADAAGQSYDTSGTLCAGCHQFENAFGLASVPQLRPVSDNEAVRVYKAGGGTRSIDWNKYVTNIADLNYLMLDASLIQGAGPTLTPANVEKGAFAAGVRGGSPETLDFHFNRRGFKPGSYAWSLDMSEVYWSQSEKSEFNGKAGSYHELGDRRYGVGEYQAGDPAIPPKPR